MKIPLYVVDAFTRRLFGGNPAAVCPLDEWPRAELMQQLARENNLSETAFFVRSGDSHYDLRWFTPTVEMDLCGHATLASAYVIFTRLDASATRLTFETRSGALTVTREGELLAMDFPSRPPTPCDAPAELLRGLGARPREVLRSRDYLVRYGTEAEVRSLNPDFRLLSRLDCIGIIATAEGREADFVSRFFAPAAGVDEDPVTGSAHCTLVPYWSEQLGKTRLRALQVSERGGELLCEQRGERVALSGHAVLYSEGFIHLP
ncbi:MAG TPA: PhzF family phenazine biosynthesis protein [Pyrinomonadaceae bacterium]|nr:PhzF family phenazine biosynthesis protein [Pyrinomonadaceae bacterium]